MKYLRAVGILACLITSIAISSETQIGKFQADLRFLDGSLDLFKQDVGRYPSTEEGLIALVAPSNIENTNPVGYLRRVPTDRWGNKYQYRNPGVRNTDGYDIWSFGADGLPGGTGFASDLGNWPGGLEEFAQAMSDEHSERTRAALPRVMFSGFIFSVLVYLGISSLQKSDGKEKRTSSTGKSIYIALVFFILFVFLVLPFAG